MLSWFLAEWHATTIGVATTRARKEDDDDDDNDDGGVHDYDGANLDVAADNKHDCDNHVYDNDCDDDDDDGTDDDDRSDGDNNNDNHEGKAFAIRTAPRRGGGEGGGACTMDLY